MITVNSYIGCYDVQLTHGELTFGAGKLVIAQTLIVLACSVVVAIAAFCTICVTHHHELSLNQYFLYSNRFEIDDTSNEPNTLVFPVLITESNSSITHPLHVDIWSR